LLQSSKKENIGNSTIVANRASQKATQQYDKSNGQTLRLDNDRSRNQEATFILEDLQLN